MKAEIKRKRETKTEQWLEGVIAYLRKALEEYSAQEAYLVGSFARGEWDDYSDIDLIVVKETDTKFLDRLKEFGELLKPYFAIDVLVYTPEEFVKMPGISGFFRHAMKDAVKIYEKR
jgi:predicted nucleotidyltransferase